MKGTKLLCFLAGLLLLSACSNSTGGKSGKDEIVTFQLSPTQEGVTEFLEKLEYLPGLYDNDKCFNITPREITTEYGYEIFKFDQSCAGYLLYDGHVCPLGEWLGGNGLVSFAVADLNGDCTKELYFTYSWGSGIHRSLAGYFDPVSGGPVSFEFANYDRDMVLAAEGDSLALFNARIEGFQSFVELYAVAEDKVAELVYESGTITLKEIDAP